MKNTPRSMIRCFLLLAFLAGYLVTCLVAIGSSQAPSDLLSIDVQNTTSFRGLIDFALQNRIAVGVVLSPEASLCNTRRRLVLKNVTVSKIMKGLLENSGSQWSYKDGVFLVKPKIVQKSIDQILRLKLPSFRSSETTFQGLGISLSSSIESILDPDAGHATSILSSSHSTKISPFTLDNVTVEQIANHIVGLDGKGAWILYQSLSASNKESVSLKIYGYQDDALALRTLPCPIEAPVGPAR